MNRKYPKATYESEVRFEPVSTFQFGKIKNGDKRLFCLQQSLFVLSWILYFKQDILSPVEWVTQNSPSPLSWLKLLRRYAGFFKQQVKLLLVFTLYKYLLGNSERVVTLPKYGQVCVPVHQGYKIFDFQRKVVAKVFDVDVNPASIGKEIDGLKKAALFEFAPSLKRWSVDERWYEEELVSGTLDASYKPMNSREVVRKFSQDLVPILNRMILLDPPLVKNVLAYAEGIAGKLGNSRLAKCEGTQKEFTTIKKFVDSMLAQLQSEGDVAVFLVFTHGDFCPANMLNAREGMKIIDWEGAGTRSLLFDVYSYFFYRPVSRRVPVATMASELHECLSLFISSLDKKFRGMFERDQTIVDVYRWTYYVEHVCKEVEREATDKNLDILADILGYIDAFHSYENLVAKKKPGAKCAV